MQQYFAHPAMPREAIKVGARVSVPDWRRGTVIGWANGTVTQVREASADASGTFIVRLDSTEREALYFGYSIGFVVFLGPDADKACPNCGASGQVSAPLYERPHPRGDSPQHQCKFVRVYDKRYLVRDIHDGDVVGIVSQDVNDCTEQSDVSPTDEAVRVIEHLGLTFDDGSSWAFNPDGSSTVDYATGEESEVTAHLYGFTPEEVEEIVRRVRFRVTL